VRILVVKFFATFRKVTKTKEYKYSGSAENIKDLLEALSKNFGNQFREMVLNGNNLSEEVIILVNGIHIAHLNGKDTELKFQDEVDIFPVVAGG
jgi:molybdopterin synthase sulfur carrier subunit